MCTDDILGVWTVAWESESQRADESSFEADLPTVMNFLIYLLLLMPGTLLGGEGKGVSLESLDGRIEAKEKPAKWSVGCCLLVSMQAQLFLRTKAQSNRASRNV